MKLSILADDGQCVRVAVNGPITQREVSPLHEPLQELLGPGVYGRTVWLDLSGTNVLDSSGVGWLLTCHKRMREAGGRLTLASPHPVVSNVLRVLKLDKVFEVEASAAKATAGGAR